VDRHQHAAVYAPRIEQEFTPSKPMAIRGGCPIRRLESDQAFFADTMTYFQWLQFVLVPRITEMSPSGERFPKESNAGAYAVRALDGLRTRATD